MSIINMPIDYNFTCKTFKISVDSRKTCCWYKDCSKLCLPVTKAYTRIWKSYIGVTKITNLLPFCWQLYYFLVFTNDGHLGFCHNAISNVLSKQTLCREYLKTQNYAFRSILSKMMVIYIAWPCSNGGHHGFYPQCDGQYNFRPHHYVGHIWKPYDRYQSHNQLIF